MNAKKPGEGTNGLPETKVKRGSCSPARRQEKKEPATAGERFFRWEEKAKWRSTIQKLLKDVVSGKVVDEFKKNPPEYVVSDDLTWLEEIIERAEGRRVSVKTVLAEKMKGHYSHVIGYHGCRPERHESYTDHGLLPCDPDELKRTAIRWFGQSPKLERALADLEKKEYGGSYIGHNEGKIFFCLEKEELIETCGHYLLYGSEYLNCVAVRIGQRERLREIGRATILECKIPSRVFPYWEELAGTVIENIFERILDPEYYEGLLNFGFYIKERLPAEGIIAIHFPTNIPNPYKQRIREN